MTTQILVEGMTCSHCVASVTEELSALEGVSGVEVALVAGGASTVRFESTASVTDAAVRAAVGEAGYTVVAAGA